MSPDGSGRWRQNRSKPHNHIQPLPEHKVQEFFGHIAQVRSGRPAQTGVDEFRALVLKTFKR